MTVLGYPGENYRDPSMTLLGYHIVEGFGHTLVELRLSAHPELTEAQVKLKADVLCQLMLGDGVRVRVIPLFNSFSEQKHETEYKVANGLEMVRLSSGRK